MSARDKLIAGTVDLIRRRGVSGASVAEILERSDVARRTLYLNFPAGKPELVAAATESASSTITLGLRSLLAEADPRRLVEDFTAMWIGILDDADYAAGCPVVAASLARDEAPAAADIAAAAFGQWMHLVTETCENAGLARADAEDLATTAVAAIEGAVIISMAQRSPEPLRRTGRDLALLAEVKLARARSEDTR